VRNMALWRKGVSIITTAQQVTGVLKDTLDRPSGPAATIQGALGKELITPDMQHGEKGREGIHLAVNLREKVQGEMRFLGEKASH